MEEILLTFKMYICMLFVPCTCKIFKLPNKHYILSCNCVTMNTKNGSNKLQCTLVMDLLKLFWYLIHVKRTLKKRLKMPKSEMDIQHNDQKKKHKRTNTDLQNFTQKTKD